MVVKDRRAQLVDAAAQLFADRGYTAVSVQEIAACAGLSAAGVYRHYPSKEAILDEIVCCAADTMASSAERCAPRGLRAMLRGAVNVVIADPDATRVYFRNRHRVATQSAEALTRTDTRLATAWHAAMTAENHDLTATDTALRQQAVNGVLGAVAAAASQRPVTRDRARIITGLEAMTTCPPPADPTTSDDEPVAWVPTLTRRQQIVRSANALFSERGFDHVGMGEIARAVGLSEGALYEYFPTKIDVLVTSYYRGSARFVNCADECLRGARSAEDALIRLVAAYARTAWPDRESVIVHTFEGLRLPEAELARALRIRADFDDLWVALLREASPTIPPNSARLVAQATIEILGQILRTRPDATPDAAIDLATAFLRGTYG